MLVGKRQTQHWMETANWENPKSSPKLQLGDQLSNILYDQTLALLCDFIKQFLGLFLSPLIGAKFRLAHKNSDVSVHVQYNQLQFIYKENFSLPPDVDSTQGSFSIYLY